MTVAGMVERMAGEAEKTAPTGKHTGRVMHWIFMTPILLFLLWYGISDLRRTPDVVATLAHLGYPWYFVYFIGTGKLLELAAFIYPKAPRLREWAYAGFTIELISAFGSHAFVGDPWGDRIMPLIFLAILAVAYWFDPYRR